MHEAFMTRCLNLYTRAGAQLVSLPECFNSPYGTQVAQMKIVNVLLASKDLANAICVKLKKN